MGNQLTLAVAGSGKTRELVEHCATLSHSRRALVVTWTQANQAELRSRISRSAGDHPGIDVVGWYTFLLRDFARPFIPFKFPGERILGFNFEGRPHRMAGGIRRFLDSRGAAYACELGRLAHELVEASGGALLRRIQCCYDEILIDEVQDLAAHDWEIIDELLRSSVSLRMVGDVRQSILSTNPRSTKNKQYAYAEALTWFRERESAGILAITENSTTWRCRPEIAAFSDTIFDSDWSFPPTESKNTRVTGHDGVFLVRSEHVYEYVDQFTPQCLRHGASSGKAFALDNYMNFGVAKGTAYERVLIVPTVPIESFIRSGTTLPPVPAARFYVAVTRAAQSVAIVLDAHGTSQLPRWQPGTSA